jgi:hypothetical protein
LYDIKKYEFGVASSGIIFRANSVKIHPMVLELKHGWMDGRKDVTIPICILFLYAVRRMYSNPNETKLMSIEQAGVVTIFETCV